MAERTSSSETVSTEEMARYLRELADAFEDAETRISVGNKSVRVSPPEEVNYSIDVIERSALLRGDHETIEIEVSWKPATSGN
ncbi:amphi-Trp domain-containing protein [Natranaeroarchaeum aerophilus]|uniref:Amphi-Trp domain-containing protein n=1 Tax=Natranaeroarchaeum aerophilus TaxID=2917711 RepID=A0AAE3FRB1_9EURY|nr:amphi-Trp domain-containing protein [Natranaeroarchaeum aerophilus]MCL9813423.1 amphi-Trp domain-containing protein [Natranaeroarchaeum aerophilus]